MSTTAASGMKHLTLRRTAEAALTNEQITRDRTAALERRTAALAAQAAAHGSLLNRGFWGRLRWLFLGR